MSAGVAAIRPQAVAGLFYPRDPARLRHEVSTLLDAAPAARFAPKAVIAPHAGYAYSGPVAAAAFTAVAPASRIVLIGPSHYAHFRGIAVPTYAAFATPLGPVPVDKAALDPLAALPFVTISDAPHAPPEHALEVELPFLQRRLENFTIVPLLVGQADPADVAAALAVLWGGPETLVVVSSDLSHFHPYPSAQRLDAATASAIEQGDWACLGPENACGYLPIAGLLIEAAHHGLVARRCALCNSGDSGGGRDRVVGYGAWILQN